MEVGAKAILMLQVSAKCSLYTSESEVGRGDEFLSLFSQHRDDFLLDVVRVQSGTTSRFLAVTNESVEVPVTEVEHKW